MYIKKLIFILIVRWVYAETLSRYRLTRDKSMCATQEIINISKTKKENKCSTPSKITLISLNIVFSVILCLFSLCKYGRWHLLQLTLSSLLPLADVLMGDDGSCDTFSWSKICPHDLTWAFVLTLWLEVIHFQWESLWRGWFVGMSSDLTKLRKVLIYANENECYESPVRYSKLLVYLICNKIFRSYGQLRNPPITLECPAAETPTNNQQYCDLENSSSKISSSLYWPQ